MPNSFDFSQVGKRLPYRLSEGSFEEMQAQVMARIETSQANTTPTAAIPLATPDALPAEPRRKWMPRFVKSFAAAAAVIGLCFVLHPFFISSTSTGNYVAQEDQAFHRLNAEDQDFLLEVYEDELFLTYYLDSNPQ
ncbi:MAG: hypothetical protein HXL30_01065 [Prevotellaceae bacterium]|jgi:hypothetical protein|nr:hypothetical protein [Prevotellaceae bacterium]